MNFSPLLATLGVTLLASCSNPPSTVDSTYAAHEANVLTSPQADAIVGMWYNFTNGGAGKSIVSTMLIRPNGTGVGRANLSGFGSDYGTKEQNFPLTWKYDGGGWWTATHASAGGYPNVAARYRTDGKVLLMANDPGGVAVRQVWVRADDAAATAAKKSSR